MAAGARPHHSARAILLVLPLPVLPRDSTVHLTTCTPLLASSASPRFWLPPPVQAPAPGSRYSYLAERARGRGKCFRGSGPGVGVCKLASVPAGAAAATGLAHCAGAWRRRRAAGQTAGGRAWQVSTRPSERSVVRADSSASAARRPWGAAREGGGEGRRGA